MPKVTKVENVVLNVRDIDEAVKFYADIFGSPFDKRWDQILPNGVKVKIALGSIGVELIQQTDPPLDIEGLRGFSFRVADINEVKTEMKTRGIPPVVEFEIPGLKEAIYNIRGMRIAFEQHES